MIQSQLEDTCKFNSFEDGESYHSWYLEAGFKKAWLVSWAPQAPFYETYHYQANQFIHTKV